MKKLLLSIAASILLVVGAKSQVADINFDSAWVNDAAGTLQDAKGWTSFNTASTFPYSMSQTVYRIAAPNSAFGLASAKVVTQKVPAGLSVPNPFRPFHNFDTVGLLCLGTIQLLPAPGLKFGAALPSGVTTPVHLNFSSKDTAMAGDSAFVLAYLTKWGQPVAGKLDTIASGKWAESSTGNSWTSHTITMIYAPGTSGITPDSMQIFVSSSIYMRGGAKIGSKYYVDSFCWDCMTGIEETNDATGIVSVSPNPATTEINFTASVNAKFVEVSDITGRKVGLFVMQNSNVKIQTDSFTPGLYLYNVMNSKKEVVARGKFEITK